MGNNASSIPNNIRRKSSVSRGHQRTSSSEGHGGNKSSHQHSEYLSPRQSHQLPINTEKGYPPPYKPKAIVSPNVFIDHLADNDYFGKIDAGGGATGVGDFGSDVERKGSIGGGEISEVLTSGSYDDDYDIDEDLINKDGVGVTKEQRESNEYKNVLIKYVNYEDTTGSSDHGIGSTQVYLITSFNNWSKKLKLERDFDGVYKIMITLPLGIYKVKFLVNNEIKYSEDLPIATDKSGNVVNWFEVDDIEGSEEVFEAGVIEQHKISNNKRKSSTSFLHTQQQQDPKSTSQFSLDQPNLKNNETYSQEIPEIFHQSDEILPVDEEFLHKNPIPELPVYLNNNILNKHFNTHHYNQSSDTAQLQNNQKRKISSSGLNSHIIPHVNLNHLLTSNIKNNVLSVACTTRYSGKFITQIMYSPSE